MILPSIASRRLFGRDAELQLLHDARRGLSRRRGATVLVGGEPGIGKSRLLAEFTASLTGGRAPYYAFGEAFEDAPRPFGPFRMVLSALVQSSRGSNTSAPTPLISRTLAALVPDAIGTSATRVTQHERIEKAELFTGILRYLTMLAEKRATVVVLEDLHWADSATLELLCHLAPRISDLRLLLVATYRDDEIHPQHRLFVPLARLSRESSVRSVVLEALTARELRALVEDALGASYSLPPGAISDVINGCDGNPFFAEEMLKRAIEHARTGKVTPLPLSIRALNLERIATLSPSERAILDFAAVVGPHFTPQRLREVTQASADAVRATIARLCDLGILIKDPDGTRFYFRHALTRQTIYDELPQEETSSRHARILAVLEAQPERDLDGLAYHAWRAGLHDQTRTYSERAGDAALEVRAAAQAATYFERALELVEDDSSRVRLLGKCGEAWLQQSDFAQAAKAYQAAQALLLAGGRHDEAARALARAAGEMANNGQIREALAALTEFEAAYGTRLGRSSCDHLNATIARLATAAEDFAFSRRALARISDPDRLEAFTHQVYWLARLFTAEHDLDLDDWRRAAAALERGNAGTYPLMRAQMLHSIASTAILFAENDEAQRTIDAALAIDREFGFYRPYAFASAVKASLLGVVGRLAEARSCIDAALAEPDMFVVRLELALGVSPAVVALGDYDLAKRLLSDKFVRTIRDSGSASMTGLLDGMRALLLFALGRTDEAAGLLDQAIDAPQHPFAPVYLWPLAARYSTESRISKLHGLCGFESESAGKRVRHAAAALLNAAGARRAGDPDAAAMGLDAACRYRTLGWPLHEAAALELAGSGAQALAIYREAGATGDLRRLAGPSHGPPARPALRGDPLSVRERQVAAMVARGFTNRAIAEELVVTEKTVEKHVTSAFAKLGFSTRAQLAAHAARHEGTSERLAD